MMKSHQQGLTLLELSVSLLIASILLGGLSGAIWQFMRIPEQQDAKLTTQHELRVATTWIRMDANKV